MIALLACAVVFAQAGSSTLRGTVVDPSGAVVAGAKVTITNLKTNLTRTQNSSASGTFSFELIPPGDYRLEVEMQGFNKKVVSPVQALVGLPVDVKVDLTVGEISSVVTVEGASTAVQVNTQDATLGNNFVSAQIAGLPLESRNVQALLTLQPAVTPQGYVAGARSDQSNITLDGVDINEAQTNALNSNVLRLNSEAVEEFRVTTVSPNSNQGRSSGAQVNLVTKSGSNAFHGTLYEYHRNTIFTANDFFSNRAGVDRKKLLRNTFGGVIGGPIKKDRLFFFYGYEGRTDASEGSATRVVPLPHLGQGQVRVNVANCSSTTTCPTYQITLMPSDIGQIYPTLAADPLSPNGLNPVALSALAQAAASYPANATSVGDGLNTRGFLFNFGTPLDNNSNTAKIDWTINSSMTAFVRINTYHDAEALSPNFPDTTQPNFWAHPLGWAVNHNWTMSSNWVNQFRYGLTRSGFSQEGDSADDSLSFRFVFSPKSFSRTLSRVTPVHNITNDATYTRGAHTFGFGTNIRLIRNQRVSFSGAFDSAITNPSFYFGGGSSVSTPVRNYLRSVLTQPTLVLRSNSQTQNAITAIVGRFSQYSANFKFALDGTPLPPGSPSERTFATEEYDVYVQDAWRMSRSVTLTLGLRYGISRPVYETKGFEVKPHVALNEFFRRRQEAARAGLNLTELITLDLSGPANGRSPMYTYDKNNFQPRAAIAWSPNFSGGLLNKIFGDSGKSVIRAGFAMLNDYYGQSLAVAFDLNNTLGFSSSTTIAANTYDMGCTPWDPPSCAGIRDNPAPLFTGFTQDARTLQGLPSPAPIMFPRTTPPATVIGTLRRIESSLDEGLTAPVSYQYNLAYERELPWGFLVQSAYIGRLGRNLLASRDIMALSNLVDPVSGMDWYTAARTLEVQRQQGVPTTSIAPVPWFQNMLPSNMAALLNACCGWAMPTTFTPTQAVYEQANGFWGNDWTDVQDEMEQAVGQFMFFHPQYGALSSWGTIANSDYHALAISVRQRTRDLQWDFNYTWSHSLDDASGLQTSGTFGSAFILNPILQHDNYGSSDFDIRQQFNVNALYQLPFGKGKRFASGVGRGMDMAIGGWEVASIARWNTGLPIFAPYDDVRWATNWNVQSSGTPIRAVPFSGCPDRGSATTAPKLFGCDPTFALQSFRNALPGETGPRNLIRLPGFWVVDMGLSKRFNITETINAKLRWEVFNITNTQHLGGLDTSRTGFGLPLDPLLSSAVAPGNWSNLTNIQGPGGRDGYRVMQVGLRIEF